MEVIESAAPKEDAGKALCDLLEKYKDTPILLMLSGGSARTILEFLPAALLGPHVTITMLDERYATDSEINNFAQLEKTNFYERCVEQGTHFISTKVLADESLEALQNRFDDALKTWRKQYKDGVVIATMGIGADGHTAGIFAGEHGVNFNGTGWVTGYSVPKEVNEYTKRVTVTNTFLRDQIDCAVVYAVGQEKHRIVKEIQSGTASIHNIPAVVLKDIKHVAIFSDVT